MTKKKEWMIVRDFKLKEIPSPAPAGGFYVFKQVKFKKTASALNNIAEADL